MSTVDLRCTSCGFRSRRKLRSGMPRPCPKCGGHMVFADKSDDDNLAGVIGIGAIVLMFIIGVVISATGIAP